jgi:hypothetical protein
MNLLQEHCNRRYSEWQQTSQRPAQTAPPPQLPTSTREPQRTRPTRRAKETARRLIRKQQGHKERGNESEGDADDDDDDDEGGNRERKEVKSEPPPPPHRREGDNNDDEKRPLRCHFFNTFFYPLLSSGGYARVARWTRCVDLMAMDLVVAPVHAHVHWTMAVACPRERTIAHYDSLQQSNDTCIERLLTYLLQEEEAKAKKKNEGDEESEEKEKERKRKWRVGNRAEETPRQTNGSDCGVFACMFARFCALGLPLSSLHQRDMPSYRRLMALEILNATILPHLHDRESKEGGGEGGGEE